MLEKIVGLLDSAYWWVIAFAFGLFSGWYVTSEHYDEKIAQDALDAAVARAEQGKKDYAKVIEAQNSLDAWRSSAESMSVELDRMRDAQRSVRESASACRVERAAVARCEGLLREGSSLLAEGADLLERNAGIHDALASTVK